MTARRQESPSALAQHYLTVRQDSEFLAAPYSEADQTIQSMPDASPIKWHLAHTSWFFETFVLKHYQNDYIAFNPAYEFLFNSYYNSVGAQYTRADRGVISRPGKDEVLQYREHVDDHMAQLFEQFDQNPPDGFRQLIELGLAHEQQHQELLVTDIQHALAMNPLYPEVTQPADAFPEPNEVQWLQIPEGLYEVGHDDDSFCFDNETPKHKVYIAPFSVADRLVTNKEYLAFMQDGGYDNPLLWLSEGWAWKNEANINAPLYWLEKDGQWFKYGLAGLRPIDLNAPVVHVSLFEASAYAHWADARLATEFEWEVVAQQNPTVEQFINPGVLQPQPANQSSKGGVQQLFNTVWQWTGSQYLPYPGFGVAEGAVGEYNGKFMSNQFVLRGGSCVTPLNHVRTTYRNFFPASARWQYTGIRIVKND
jgi:ergothioneine biosynthesis protein EgtB